MLVFLVFYIYGDGCIFPLHREFFGQGWMKNDKNERTPYIMKTTKHFNDVCNNVPILYLHMDLNYLEHD